MQFRNDKYNKKGEKFREIFKIENEISVWR